MLLEWIWSITIVSPYKKPLGAEGNLMVITQITLLLFILPSIHREVVYQRRLAEDGSPKRSRC